MSIFKFSNYKDFVRDYLKNQPHKGHGQLSKIAKELNIHTSLVSHIFNGDKHLSFEQACDLSVYLTLNSLEEDYFIALVQYERAGNPAAKKRCEREIKKLKLKSEELKERIPTDVILSDAESSVFFSQWYYAAVKQIVTLPNCDDASEISKRLRLPPKLVIELLDFLVQSRLLILENGKYTQGPSKIHLDADSPFVSRHHANWRIKSMGHLDVKTNENLFFTMPANLSHENAKAIREILVETAETCANIVDSSSVETMYCLNIDWMKILD